MKKVIFCLLALGLCTGFQSSPQLLEHSLSQKGNHPVTIRSHLSDEEADQILAHLKSLGIEATKEKTKSDQLPEMTEKIWEIKVKLTDAVEAIVALDKAGLPPAEKSHLFEEYMKRQRERYDMEKEEIDLAEGLTYALEKIKGVNEAEVLITYPTDDAGENNSVHATVYISHTGFLDDPSGKEMKGIKQFILKWVDGLKEQNLTLIAERNAVSSKKKV